METGNKETGLSKAQQFFKDVGLFIEKPIAKLDTTPMPNNILHFLGGAHAPVMTPDRALPIHINNLINTYGYRMVVEAFSAEIEAIEKENRE